MNEIELPVTGFIITEQNELEHILLLVCQSRGIANEVDKRLGDYVRLLFETQTMGNNYKLHVSLIDSNESFIMYADKRTCKPLYIDWLTNARVTHIGVCFFDGKNDIPLLPSIRPLSW